MTKPDAEATVEHAVISAIAYNWHIAADNPPDFGVAVAKQLLAEMTSGSMAWAFVQVLLPELPRGRELCETCGIDTDIVTERLMQAQARVNELTLVLLARGREDVARAKELLRTHKRSLTS